MPSLRAACLGCSSATAPVSTQSPGCMASFNAHLMPVHGTRTCHSQQWLRSLQRTLCAVPQVSTGLGRLHSLSTETRQSTPN
jgi:hypothetical protein